MIHTSDCIFRTRGVLIFVRAVTIFATLLFTEAAHSALRCANVFLNDGAALELLVSKGFQWVKTPTDERPSHSDIELEITRLAGSIPWNTEKNVTDLMKKLNFRRIGQANGFAGTWTGPRGERGSALFIQTAKNQPVLLARFRNNLGIGDTVTAFNVPRVSILLKPSDLQRHLDAIIDLAQNWGARGILIRRNYQLEILFETERMMGSFPQVLSSYLKQQRLHGFPIPFKELKSDNNVYYSEIDGAFAVLKARQFLGEHADKAECAAHVAACIAQLRLRLQAEGVDIQTSRSHNRSVPKKDPQPLQNRLDETPLPQEFADNAQSLEIFPEGFRTKALRAARYVMGLHNMKDRQEIADVANWPQDPEMKMLAQKVHAILNSPKDLSKFFLDLFYEVGFEMKGDPSMATALAAGALPREAIYKVFARWHREMGFNQFGVIGSEFLSADRFREMLSNGAFIDYGFQFGSISHGVDAHAFQIMYVWHTLRAQGESRFPDFLRYLAFNSTNIKLWDELFDNPTSKVGRLTSPEQITEIYWKFTGLR